MFRVVSPLSLVFKTLCINKGATLPYARFEVFKAVKIQVEFFWVVMPCSVVFTL
jgi:hypothetical protein